MLFIFIVIFFVLNLTQLLKLEICEILMSKYLNENIFGCFLLVWLLCAVVGQISFI